MGKQKHNVKKSTQCDYQVLGCGQAFFPFKPRMRPWAPQGNPYEKSHFVASVGLGRE